MLIVGTRGRSSVKGFLLGSVSRYCLHHSTVPVIVVRPERKLNKSKTKAKGIFRRRSSVQPEDQGYHPIQTPIDLLNSANTSANTSTSTLALPTPNNNNKNQLSTPGIPLFPSATVSVGESFSSRSNSGSGNRPRSSIFDSSSNNTPLYTNSPPPPDGVLKMKKSLTSDGSTPSKSNRKSTGFLSLSLGGKDKDKEKEKEKEKESTGSGVSKNKKRHSHGG